MDLQSHSEVEVGSSRSFGIVFAVVFTAIGLYPLIDDNPVRIWSLAIAALFLLLAFVAPSILDPLNKLWFKFGMLLARIVNPIVMFVIFVVSVLPIALILRLLRKDLLRLKFAPEEASYWIVRSPPGPEPESLEDLF